MLEAEVVVKMAGEMLLHAEEALAPLARRDLALGLGRLCEIPLPLVLVESHLKNLQFQIVNCKFRKFHFTPCIIVVNLRDRNSRTMPATIGSTLTAPNSSASGISS